MRTAFLLLFLLLSSGLGYPNLSDITSTTLSSSDPQPSLIPDDQVRVSNQTFLTFNGLLIYLEREDLVSSVVVRDTNGNLINKQKLGSFFTGSVELVNETTVIVGFIGGVEPLLWNFEKNITKNLPFLSHHDIIYSHQTNTYLTLQYDYVTRNGINYLYDNIVELSSQGEILWQFKFADIITDDQWNGDLAREAYRDMTHANSLEWNPDTGKIWANLRNTNQIYQIDYASKSVDWILGDRGNFQLFEDGASMESIFHEAHGLKVIDPSTMLLFDNQYLVDNQLRSRIIKISLDLKSLNAVVAASWVAPADLFSLVWGSVDQLPNGNLLSSFGYNDQPSIVEVNMTSQEYSLYSLPSGVYNIAFRYLTPQISVVKGQHLISSVEENLTTVITPSFRWDFNETVSISIYLNSSHIHSEEVSLRQNWTPTSYPIQFPPLKIGVYNLTLTLSKGGRSLVQQFFVNVLPYYFAAESSILVEGKAPIVLPLQGKFPLPVDLVLSNLTQVLLNQSWSGSPLSIDISSFSFGNYSLSYTILNGTTELENGTILLSIFPPSPPQVKPPLSTTFEWGVPIILVIKIYDISSYTVTLKSEGVTWFSHQYLPSVRSVEIHLPVLHEGFHRFDLQVTDSLGLENKTQVLFEVVPPAVPIVISKNQKVLDWGKTKRLTWEVHGATNVSLLRDGELLKTQSISVTQFTYLINWRGDNWKLHSYNLTLEVSNVNTTLSFSESISVDVKKVDRYASAIVDSGTNWVSDAGLSLGSPDGRSAEVSFGYENGELTLDMEAVVLNSNAEDLIIYGSGGSYRVLVSQHPLSGYVEIGRANGTASIDLGSSSAIEYVKIEYISGNPVLIDAVEALTISEQQEILFPPRIKEVSIPESRSSYNITWNISDYLGITYLIRVNGEQVIQDVWNGSPISYMLKFGKTSEYHVTLVTEDILGSEYTAEVVVTVVAGNNLFWFALVAGLVLVGLIVYNRRKRLL